MVEQERKLMHLHESEAVVVHSASRILAAYIASDKVNEQNEDEMMEKAINMAIKMAHRTDKLVMDDAEIPKRDERLPY